MSDYQKFLAAKQRVDRPSGFEASSVNGMLFPFQQAIVKWACRRGRAALFADCGLGKTGMQLEWARQVCEHTGGKVLVLAPLAVAAQTVREASKFGIDGAGVVRSGTECDPFRICVANYEMLQHFDPSEFAGVVLDESSILKNFTGSTRNAIIDAFRQTQFKLACTATPAPNDYMELGNHAEFVGAMTRTEMLSMFFCHDGGDTSQWRLKGHAESDFWRWVCSWAVSMRRPSDIGFDDDGFDLPPIEFVEHLVQADPLKAGVLFEVDSPSLEDRRRARKASIAERVAVAVSLAHDESGLQQALLPGEQGSREGSRSCVVSPEQAGTRQGGEVCIHEALLPGTSREVGFDEGEEGSQEPKAPGEVCRGRGVSRKGKGIREKSAGSRKKGDEDQVEVRDDDGSVRCAPGESVGSLRHLPDGEPDEVHVPDDRPLPRDGGCQRNPVRELQPWPGEVQGSFGSPSSCHRVSEPWIFWCGLNDEQDRIASYFGDAAFSVQGSDSAEDKEDRLNRWLDGERPVMVSKVSVLGFGINMQHCRNMAFVGLSDSYEALYQAVRRCWRFGQKRTVNVHIVTASTEGAVLDNVKRKEKDAEEMAASMVAHMADISTSELKGTARNIMEYQTKDVSEGLWTMKLGDCVERIREIDSDSVGFSVFSPPFASLYTYSASDRDMGNCLDDEQFAEHFSHLVPELFRVTKPGRLLSFHCMNLPTSKARDGVIGIRDFRGELIRIFAAAGWIFHSEVCIWKDPVTAMQRTKALGLLHKQLKKDSCMSRQGIPDYLVTMRKPGVNDDPVSNTNETFPVSEWQHYASPVWMDINPSETLQGASAREDQDERHICPLQLDVIRRALRLWSKPGDLVLSPFAGIGSEGYESVKAGRRFIGLELKRSYFDQACANLRAAAQQSRQRSLFGAAEAAS